MRLEDLRPAPGSKRERKRLGRGNASGHGNQSGRGTKGQKARSGVRMVPGFEGGQTPLWKRIPKRGFRNPFRRSYVWVNLDVLAEAFEDGAEITPEVLRERGLIKGQFDGVKILGRGKENFKKRLIVYAHRFSEGAREAIERAGGKAILLAPPKAEEAEEEEAEAEGAKAEAEEPERTEGKDADDEDQNQNKSEGQGNAGDETR